LQGFVYVKFANVHAASAAQKALHGRWFAGKQVCADFQFAQLFDAHFKI
jgi:RNA-binding protein 39